MINPLLKPLLFALLIGASLPWPWLSPLVYGLLWASAFDALRVMASRARDPSPSPAMPPDYLDLRAIFGTALVTWTALLAGYPASAALYLTARLAIAMPAFQRP